MTVKVVDIITNFAIEIPLHYYIITKVFNYSSWLVSNRLLANTGYDPLVQKRWHKVTFEDRGRQRNGPRVMELHTVQRFLSISLQLEQHWSSGVLSKGGFTPQYLPSSLWRNSVLQLCLKFKGLFKWLAMERKREKMSQKKLSDSIGSQTWVTLCFFLNPSVTRQQLHESAFSLVFTITFLPSRSCIIPIFHHPEPLWSQIAWLMMQETSAGSGASSLSVHRVRWDVDSLPLQLLRLVVVTPRGEMLDEATTCRPLSSMCATFHSSFWL